MGANGGTRPDVAALVREAFPATRGDQGEMLVHGLRVRMGVHCQGRVVPRTPSCNWARPAAFSQRRGSGRLGPQAGSSNKSVVYV